MKLKEDYCMLMLQGSHLTLVICVVKESYRSNFNRTIIDNI